MAIKIHKLRALREDDWRDDALGHLARAVIVNALTDIEIFVKELTRRKVRTEEQLIAYIQKRRQDLVDCHKRKNKPLTKAETSKSSSFLGKLMAACDAYTFLVKHHRTKDRAYWTTRMGVEQNDFRRAMVEHLDPWADLMEVAVDI